MAKFTTAWHRFNTVDASTTQTSPNSTDNIIGSGIGTASLDYFNPGSVLELSDPTVINSDGDTSTFSNVIPTDAVITGIQYQVYLDSPLNTVINVFRHEPKIGTTTITGTGNGVSDISMADVYGGSLTQFQSSITDNDLGLGSALSLSNVNDIKFRLNYIQQIGPGNSFYVIGKDFEDANGPSPAVRLEYERRPKVSINTGKIKLTEGKVHIV